MTNTLVSCTADALEEDATVRFVSPLPGFEQYDCFTLCGIDDSPIYWLQCMDEPEIALPVAEAQVVDPSYAFELSDADTHSLRLRRPQDAFVLVVLSVDGESGAITANQFAPLVVNRALGTAKQVILDGSSYSLHYPVIEI